MPLGWNVKRAHFLCALFLLVSFLFFPPGVFAEQSCLPDRLDAEIQVAHVYDGDTIKTVSGERIRFIGINTPEINHHGQASEPFSQQARKKLIELLAQHNNRIQLRFGSERKDRYKRLLAHPFLKDGTNISQWLLQQGLGFQIVVPPNTWGYECYADAEQQARNNHAGIWGHSFSKPLESKSIIPGGKGFRVIKGKVKRIGNSKKSIWLNLEGKVALRIARTDLGYFKKQELLGLKGRTVVARGWIYPYNEKTNMRIRHPASLKILEP
jgi:endonuclease YncB( thermonuclease family)